MSSPTPAFDPARTALLVMDFQPGVPRRAQVIDTATLRGLLSP
jgi:hypothetical protein